MKGQLAVAMMGLLVASCRGAPSPRAEVPERTSAPSAMTPGCPGGVHDAKFRVVFERMDLDKAVGTLSEMTCRRFTVGEGVRGQLWLDTGGLELTGEQLYGAVVVALAAQGFALEESGSEVRIVRKPALRFTTLKALGADAFEVERSDLERALDDVHSLIELSQSARIVPAFKDGAAQGFKLFSIRPDSIFAQLDLRNGDVVERINGRALASPDEAKSALNALRGASQVEVQVDRRGSAVHKVCTVK